MGPGSASSSSTGAVSRAVASFSARLLLLLSFIGVPPGLLFAVGFKGKHHTRRDTADFFFFLKKRRIRKTRTK